MNPRTPKTPDAAEADSDRPPEGRWLAVDVLDPEGRLAQAGWFADRLGAVGGVLRCEGEVRVRVVGDEEMSRVHERFSGVAGTTDVLTFDLRDQPEGPLDTDLVVCADEAARQAALRGHALERELLLYAVHGLLHCLGHDDHDPDAAAEMHRREDEVLEALGVGRTYAGGDPC